MHFVDDDVTVGADFVGLFGAASLRRTLPEVVARFVEQRDVVVAPANRADVLGTRAVQRQVFVFVELTRSSKFEQCFRAEQIVQQVGGREHWPHAFECLTHLGHVANTFLHLSWGDLAVAPRCGHRCPHFAFDPAARRVVAAEAALSGANDAGCFLLAQAQITGAEPNNEVFSQRALAIGDGLVDDHRHAQIALGASGKGRIVATPRDVMHEIGEHNLLDAGLAKRRQHALDVAQEHTVGANDQDTLVFERESECVEQVGSAVQRNHGLAGARPTLHHQHAGLRRADDFVLLTLDGGNNVAELTRATALEHGQQRAVATKARTGLALNVVFLTNTEMASTKEFILDAEQVAPLHGEVTTARKAHRFAASGPVERLGHRRTPIDHDGFAIVVGNGQTTDVKALDNRGFIGRGFACHGVAVAIDTSKDKRCIAQIELGETIHQGLVEHIALVTGLNGAAQRAFVDVAQLPGVGSTGLETPVGVVDVGLFVCEIGVLLCHVGVDPAQVRYLNQGRKILSPYDVVAMPPSTAITEPVT